MNVGKIKWSNEHCYVTSFHEIHQKLISDEKKIHAILQSIKTILTLELIQFCKSVSQVQPAATAAH